MYFKLHEKKIKLKKLKMTNHKQSESLITKFTIKKAPKPKNKNKKFNNGENRCYLIHDHI